MEKNKCRVTRNEIDEWSYRAAKNFVANGVTIKDTVYILNKLKSDFNKLLEEPEWNQTS